MENRFDARDRLNALSTGTKILLPAAVLLLIDLFLPWQDFGNDATEALGLDVSWNGWHGFWGVLLGLVTIALIVWVGLQIAGVDLSGVNLPVTHAMITLGLGVLLLAVAIVKLLTILGDEATIWAFIGTLLAAAAAYGAYQRSREMDELAPAGGVGSGRSGGGMTSDYGSTAGTGVTGTGMGTGMGTDVPPPPPTGATTTPGTTTTGSTTTGGTGASEGTMGSDVVPEPIPEERSDALADDVDRVGPDAPRRDDL